MATYTSTTSTSKALDGFDFGAIDKDLEGRVETVVTNSTLASVAKQHSECLQRLVSEVTRQQSTIARLEDNWAVVEKLQERVVTLEDGLRRAQATIQKQQEMLAKQEEIMEFGRKLERLLTTVEQIEDSNERRDRQITSQRGDHDTLVERVTKHETEDAKYKDGLQDGTTIISCKSVRVEDERAQLNAVLVNRRKNLKRMDESVFEMKEAIERKADLDAIEETDQQAKDNAQELLTIKSSLKAIGIDLDDTGDDGNAGGIFMEMANTLKTQQVQLDETSQTCSRVERGLLDKADAAHVDELIEGKYQEVVDHLQKAISAAADDEMEFKRVALELQDNVKQLMASKADRVALLEMKDQILNDSRLHDKLLALNRTLDEKIDRSEAVEMVAAKPDKEEILSDVNRSMNHIVTKAIADSQPDAGWATRTTFDSNGRPKTGDGARGSRNLLCISCNTKISKGALDQGQNLSDASSAYMYRERSREGGNTMNASRSVPVMGPGGPSLGGGFQVRIPDSNNQGSTRSARQLPKIRAKANSRVIIGANGIVYPAADPRATESPTSPMPVRSQSLPPAALHSMAGAGGPETAGAGDGAYDEGFGSQPQFQPPPSSAGNGVIRPVSLSVHDPTF